MPLYYLYFSAFHPLFRTLQPGFQLYHAAETTLVRGTSDLSVVKTNRHFQQNLTLFTILFIMKYWLLVAFGTPCFPGFSPITLVSLYLPPLPDLSVLKFWSFSRLNPGPFPSLLYPPLPLHSSLSFTQSLLSSPSPHILYPLFFYSFS